MTIFKWVSFLMICSLAFAGEDPLAPLSRLAGDWEVTFTQIDKSGEYQPVGTSLSHFEVKLGGKLVQEELLIRTATRDLPLLVNYSYDFARKVYRKASIDGITGLMDIQEGTMTDGLLSISNTKYQTWFIGTNGDEVAFRINFNLSDSDQPIMVADISLDHGQTWLKFQKLYYRRIQTLNQP